MNIENALKIPGFTNPAELEWLAQQASRFTGNIAEIGSWKGKSTRAMADNTTATIYAVDTWKGTPEDPHMRELQGKDEKWLLQEFINNIGEDHLKEPHHVRICCEDDSSMYYARYLGGGCYDLKFDMIFIDAGHSYEAVKADILAWLPLLTPGGLFCGHDYYPGRGGVIPAVDQFVPNAKKVGVGTIWMAG